MGALCSKNRNFASDPGVPPTPQSQTTVKHTRVLWDFENVSVPSGIDTVEAVCALERWLETRGLWGAGVVGLITAFFNPDSVGTKMRDALNRANVEQVLASAKREDADRKLNARLWRDLELLPTGAATAFVFITADMDFIEQLRRVRERGGPTVLLTTAPHGSAHYIALAFAATETHSWRDIVCTAPAPAPPLPPPPPTALATCLTASGGNGGSETSDASVPVAEKAAAEKAAAEKAAAVKAAAEKAAAERAAAEKAAAEKAAADKAAAEAEKVKAKKRAKKEKQKKKKKKKKKKAQGAGATVGDDDDDDDDDDDKVAPSTAPPVPVRYEAKCSYWDGPRMRIRNKQLRSRRHWPLDSDGLHETAE